MPESLGEAAGSRIGCATPIAVMLVDDNQLILRKTRELLQEHGFAVVVARSAQVALDELEIRSFDFLFTDVQMPGDLDGVELAFTAKARWPKMRIIVTSGDLDARSRRLPAGSAFLSKPYRPHNLLDALQPSH